MGVFVLVLIVAAISAFFFAQEAEKQKTKELLDAANAYKCSLEILKSKPADPNLKEHTLRRGREYASITRKYKGTIGVTIYDEVAIGNDISAPCAAAAIKPESKHAESSIQSVGDSLEKLMWLYDQKLISEQEYNEKRKELLQKI
jgi:hypothetical protein